MFNTKMRRQVVVQSIVDERIEALVIELARRARRSKSEYVRLLLIDHIDATLTPGEQADILGEDTTPPPREPRTVRRAGQRKS